MSIVIEDISKSYGNEAALETISMNIDEGELYGLIGAGSAVKTDLRQIMTTFLLPYKCIAIVEDDDLIKRFKVIGIQVGYMPGRFSLYQDLTVEENLHFFATIFGTTITENYDLIKDIYVQIEPFKNRRAGKLSGGM